MYKICSPVMYQLRVHTSGASLCLASIITHIVNTLALFNSKQEKPEDTCKIICCSWVEGRENGLWFQGLGYVLGSESLCV